MEENILILKMFIEDLDELAPNEEFVLQDECKFQVKQSIENLIKRNKELESYYQCEANLLDKYVSKDKIKEKIEEIDKERVKMEKADYGIGFTLDDKWSDIKAKIQVLEELLEEKQ
jgi:hypothetical protein